MSLSQIFLLLYCQVQRPNLNFVMKTTFRRAWRSRLASVMSGKTLSRSCLVGSDHFLPWALSLLCLSSSQRLCTSLMRSTLPLICSTLRTLGRWSSSTSHSLSSWSSHSRRACSGMQTCFSKSNLSMESRLSLGIKTRILSWASSD